MLISRTKTTFFLFNVACLYYGTASGQSFSKIPLLNSPVNDDYYLAVEPERDSVSGVLLLLAGFGQRPEDILPETKLQNVAYANNILTIAFAGGNKLYADSITQHRLNAVVKDVLSKNNVSTRNFVLGGYSAGGMIALRYVELCNEFPERFPIQPKGVLWWTPLSTFSPSGIAWKTSPKTTIPNPRWKRPCGPWGI